MKIGVRRLAIARAIADPLAEAATAQRSAAPIGRSIKAAEPAVTTNMRHQVYRDNSYAFIGIIPTLRTGAVSPITAKDDS
jgi:hypothetical protein